MVADWEVSYHFSEKTAAFLTFLQFFSANVFSGHRFVIIL